LLDLLLRRNELPENLHQEDVQEVLSMLRQ